MKTSNSQLLLLKDLIEIATEKLAMELIFKELKGKIKKEDISHTILEITGLCPLCSGRRKLGTQYCPSCMNGFLRFKTNKLKRYRTILKVTPDILNKLIKN